MSSRSFWARVWGQPPATCSAAWAGPEASPRIPGQGWCWAGFSGFSSPPTPAGRNSVADLRPSTTADRLPSAPSMRYSEGVASWRPHSETRRVRPGRLSGRFLGGHRRDKPCSVCLVLTFSLSKTALGMWPLPRAGGAQGPPRLPKTGRDRDARLTAVTTRTAKGGGVRCSQLKEEGVSEEGGVR